MHSSDSHSIITVDSTLSHDDPQLKNPWRTAAQLSTRILAQDPQAMLKVQTAGSDSTNLYFSTPLGSLVTIRVLGIPETDGSASLASEASQGIEAFLDADDFAPESVREHIDLGQRMDFMWSSSLPGQDGFTYVDTVPLEVLRSLYADMEQQNSLLNTPAGLSSSLLDQRLLTVKATGTAGVHADGHRDKVILTGREVALMGALGIIQTSTPDSARVSKNEQWYRIDTPIASVYTPIPGMLARVPSS